MRLILALCLLGLPAAAQDAEDLPEEREEVRLEELPEKRRVVDERPSLARREGELAGDEVLREHFRFISLNQLLLTQCTRHVTENFL